MRVDLDAKVRTRDGHDVGSVESAVIDPERNEVTDFVINTGGLLGRDILIPRQVLEGASKDGDVLRLDLSKADLEKMPSYVPTDYMVPPVAWIPPSGFLYPTAGYVWPVSGGVESREGVGPAANLETNAELKEATRTSINVNKGAPVLDRDGDDIGVVDDVRLDGSSGRVTGFVVRIGGFLPTLFGGGDTVDLPGDAIERVDASGRIRLRVNREELARGRK